MDLHVFPIPIPPPTLCLIHCINGKKGGTNCEEKYGFRASWMLGVLSTISFLYKVS